jgi:hypothetical protein
MGVHLGVWGLIPSHSLHSLHSREHVMWLPGLLLGPQPRNPLALVASQMLGLRHFLRTWIKMRGFLASTKICGFYLFSLALLSWIQYNVFFHMVWSCKSAHYLWFQNLAFEKHIVSLSYTVLAFFCMWLSGASCM